jgi:deazaflavin-dependent oxidoreductase (nitroreductase family)
VSGAVKSRTELPAGHTPHPTSCFFEGNAVPNKSLKDQLSRRREITLTVTGRKSGRKVSIPVWFVLEGEALYLLPAQGSDTQWYKNVLKNPAIQVSAGGSEAQLTLVPITDPKQVSSVVQKFRDKHGADVSTYYSKFDVAAMAQVG